MDELRRIGVVGAGTMGSALAQKFAQEGLEVVLVDREMTYVNKGMENIKATLQEGVERNIFTSEQVNEILKRIHGSENINDLAECNIVVEAIFEDFGVKTNLFKGLSEILSPQTILATNTSSFSISELAESYRYPERFIGLHYFYHAAKNRLVEIIPGRKTASETIREARRFAEMTGKDPIFCKDRYGFAVNRFFVPWLNEAVRLLEDGVADTATIDAVCRKTFQIGMGPFALMNATGVPIAYHSQKTLEVLGPFYQVAPLLKEQAESNQLWEIPEIDESKISENIARTISERMLGVVFLVCSQILDEEVCSATELNRGARIGLRWRKGPVELMQLMGETEVQRLIEQIASRYNTPLPMTIHPDYWQLKWVQYEKKGDLAIITISRPEDLNALNETVVEQLSAKFDKALSDSEVKKVLITGSGKAFMAGADIKFFVKNMKQHRLERIVEFTRRGQELFEKIDHSPKPVIALVNGLALGGGLELALCADLIFAVSGATMAFPETGIGIYPGLGGTYRTPSRVGKAMAKYLIFSGKMLTAWEAWEIGLIDGVLTREELFFIKEGIMKIPDRQPAPPITGTKWEKIKQLFERMSLKDLLEKEVLPAAPEKEILEKIRKVLKRKAPIPLRIVEELIDRAESPKQELEYLEQVFSSEDALTGLSNIGKPVTFQGK